MPTTKSVLAELEKSTGRKLGSLEAEDPPRLPTGIFPFDLATGGGFPLGRISMVFGPEASMKTTLCLKAVAQAQRLFPKLTAVFVDAEGHLSTAWARTLGVDTGRLVHLIPLTAEEVVDMVSKLMLAEDVSVIVVDSLAALITEREVDSAAADSMVGVSGLLINKFYRKISHAMNVARYEGHYPTLLLVNQIRFKIGERYGDPEVTPGGPSIRFAASLMVRLYGKDEFDKEVSKDLPAFKKVSVILKKWKVPVLARNSEFMLALQRNEKLGLEVGDPVEFNTILQYLKLTGLLAKGKKKGWIINIGGGVEFDTQADFKQRLIADPSLGDALRITLLEQLTNKGSLLDAQET